MAETTVVNIRRSKCDVLIGRDKRGNVPEPPAAGCFGNPFKVEDFGRTECLRRFSEYFHERLATDAEFLKAVLALKGLKLGCYCKPLPCHGDIIAAFLNQEHVDGQ